MFSALISLVLVFLLIVSFVDCSSVTGISPASCSIMSNYTLDIPQPQFIGITPYPDCISAYFIYNGYNGFIVGYNVTNGHQVFNWTYPTAEGGNMIGPTAMSTDGTIIWTTTANAFGGSNIHPAKVRMDSIHRNRVLNRREQYSKSGFNIKRSKHSSPTLAHLFSPQDAYAQSTLYGISITNGSVIYETSLGSDVYGQIYPQSSLAILPQYLSASDDLVFLWDQTDSAVPVNFTYSIISSKGVAMGQGSIPYPGHLPPNTFASLAMPLLNTDNGIFVFQFQCSQASSGGGYGATWTEYHTFQLITKHSTSDSTYTYTLDYVRNITLVIDQMSTLTSSLSTDPLWMSGPQNQINGIELLTGSITFTMPHGNHVQYCGILPVSAVQQWIPTDPNNKSFSSKSIVSSFTIGVIANYTTNTVQLDLIHTDTGKSIQLSSIIPVPGIPEYSFSICLPSLFYLEHHDLTSPYSQYVVVQVSAATGLVAFPINLDALHSFDSDLRVFGSPFPLPPLRGPVVNTYAESYIVDLRGSQLWINENSNSVTALQHV